MRKTKLKARVAQGVDDAEVLAEPRLAMPRLHVAERRLILIGLDFAALSGALVLWLSLRGQDPDGLWFIAQHPLWLVLINALWYPLAYAFDAYDVRVVGKISTTVRAILRTGALTALIFFLIRFLTPAYPMSWRALVLFVVFVVGLPLFGRGLYLLVLARLFSARSVLIIGAGWAGRTIAEAIAHHGKGAYHIVGFIDDDPAKRGATFNLQHNGGRTSAVATAAVLGDRHTLRQCIIHRRVNTLVLAITNQVGADLLQVLMDCLELGVEIVPMAVLYEQLTGRVPVEHVGNSWHVSMPINHAGTRALWAVAKRAMDVLLGSAGLVCLALALPLVALAIYLDSPGPIFYGQERVGKGGRGFRIYKFRSMVPDAEEDRAVWAQANDRRVTRVGRWLRKTYVDEFPQFLNILKGDMSAVGPRPERPEFVEQLAKEIPFYRIRHAVKPGMAGWGLVKQGYGASKQDALLKLQYDLYYIKHQSLWLDIIILLKTVVCTLTFRGRA